MTSHAGGTQGSSGCPRTLPACLSLGLSSRATAYAATRRNGARPNPCARCTRILDRWCPVTLFRRSGRRASAPVRIQRSDFCDDGVVLLCAVIIPVMLNSVPDLQDILDRFLLLGGDTEAEVLQARKRITNADCLRVVGDLRVDVLEDENRVCLREPLLLGSYKSA